jgi:hypothetical protein
MRDLQRFGGMVTSPGGRKWVTEELAVVSESKEVAGDMITDVVLDQVRCFFVCLMIDNLSSLV